ncbi:PD-(D/E)XK nuclease family protein [Methylococcus sp. EFPC2]|uniref:PD-(D/E)XK nuclease family protein n=1 Tax=Methylococcus sp. EFPC2 TaxID=2812648 RepID=UPI0019670C7A|nr:PD-(D/E)XK nuclease family protein [Methylococcus sp. EFPC2]QSA96181.1 PD-(D/E)XK nuclease family protein [Methylococcus sp. EFPC2]
MISLDKYEKLIQEIKELTRQRVERNIFSIGGRGHYENPITDLLAFFINPNEEHGFGVLFMKSLFESAHVTPPLLQLSSPPGREQYTDQGNRLDLILEGDDWLLVVENKVWHQAINPFDEYAQYARASYRKKTRYFILLSVREEKPPTGWHTVTWRTYVDQVKKNAGEYLTTAGNVKWHVIMREFLLNIESECGDESMSDARIEFVRSNYEAIQEMEEMLKEYISHMTNRGLEAIRTASGQKEDIASSKQHNWGEEGIALRLLSRAWGAKTNITLLLKKDGSLTIQFYVYDVADEKAIDLREHIDETKYKKLWTEAKTIRCFGFYEECNHDKVFQEVIDVAKRLNEFYAS